MSRTRLRLRSAHVVVWSFLTLTLGVWPARPTLSSPLNLTTLVEDADFIVVGRVASTEQRERTSLGPSEGSTPAWVTIVHLDVERVIKGNPEMPAVAFRMVVPVKGIGAEPTGYKDVSVGDFGVFFLRKAQLGYEVLDPYHPFVPAAPGAPGGQGNCMDAVTEELEQVFRSQDKSVQSRSVRWEAVRALETVHTPKGTSALKAASNDTDTLVRIWAVSALLGRNDISMLGQVEDLVALPPDPHAVNLSSQLGMAIGRINNPRAVSLLARLLDCKDANIRRGAASALRNTRDSAAIKPLLKALYDPDREVRYYAVVGLGEITGQDEWTPSVANFQQNEKLFLDHWREWAKAQK